MNSVEIFAVIIGAIAGYLIISHLMRLKPRARASNPRPRPQDPELAAWEGVLEISRSATADDIRRAYRTQISKYHPDKVASLSEEFKSIAEQKAKEINAAYAQAMRDKAGAA
jgi:preprotein translocase subunit Sec63